MISDIERLFRCFCLSKFTILKNKSLINIFKKLQSMYAPSPSATGRMWQKVNVVEQVSFS